MATEQVQPMPGRRPVYPVDSDDDGQTGNKPSRHEATPGVAPEGSADDPASDEKTESANHPNDE